MSEVERVLSGLAAIEETARGAGGEQWRSTEGGWEPMLVIEDGSRFGGETVVYDEGSPSEAQAAHMAMMDPAFTLRLVEALREVVALCDENHETFRDLTDEEYAGARDHARDTIAALARAFGDEQNGARLW